MTRIIFLAIVIFIQFWNGHVQASSDKNQKQIIILNACADEPTLAEFEKQVLLFPHLLSEFDEVVLLVPEKLQSFTPLSKQAPLIEKARILLTWTNIFQRKELKNAAVRIIITENLNPNREQIESILNAVHARAYSSENYFVSCKDLLSEQSDIVPEKVNYLSFDATMKDYRFPQQTIFDIPFEFSKNEKLILITGGAGFIGSHLVKEFLKKGYRVIAMDNLSCCSIDNISDIITNPNFHFIEHDVAKPFDISGHLDGILHLASVPSPEMYYNMPIETMEAGLHGTRNCLEIARKKNARFLFASTSEVYGDPEVNPQTEDYPGNVNVFGPRAQYDQSKRGGETFVKLYFENFNIDVRIARIFNTYGPYMQLGDGRVVTNFIRAALANEPMYIYGSGTQTRSFAYVNDTVEGIIRLYETENIKNTNTIDERVFNIGNNKEFTIIELAQRINTLAKEFLDREIPIKKIEQIDETDPKLRCPEISKAQNIFGFSPCISLEEGLKKTFLYFLERSSFH